MPNKFKAILGKYAGNSIAPIYGSAAVRGKKAVKVSRYLQQSIIA